MKGEPMKRVKKWTRENIIPKVIEIHSLGKPLNARYISLHYGGLYRQSCKPELFGSWDNTLLTAGFDPAEVRLQKEHTEESIVAAIRKIRAAGHPLNFSYAKKHYKDIYSAAILRKGWKKYVELAGFDYAEIHKCFPGKWTRRYVLSCIDWLHFWGCPLNVRCIEKKYNPLYKRARKLFGSWKNALRKAGLDPEKIQLQKRHSEKSIIREIKRLKKEGVPLNAANISKVYPSLYAAARYLLGWGEFVERAGFDYMKESICILTKTRIRNLSEQKIRQIKEKYSTKQGGLHGKDRKYGSTNNSDRKNKIEPRRKAKMGKT